MTQSYVPQVLARMLTVARTALPDTDVFLGEPPGGDIPHQYASVAYAGAERAGVSGARAVNPHSEHWAEQFTVWCCVSTATGDQDAAAAITDTNALFLPWSEAIVADRTLGGLLTGGGYADLGSFEWFMESGGEIATVFFEVFVAVQFGA
jgi:hypothetical protein